MIMIMIVTSILSYYFIFKVFKRFNICIYPTTIMCKGRLGNQIIRNLAVSLIAKKHNIKVNYCNEELINKLGIFLFSGTNYYYSYKTLNDDNYFSIYNAKQINFNLDPNRHYFQTKEICNFLYHYMHSNITRSYIIEKNIFKHRYNNNNDLLIHIRLGDAEKWNVGIDYYLNTIKEIIFDNLYITTDNKTHAFIKAIIEIYPMTIIIDYDEINTLQFSSTCKYVILSHGSFSAVIGYLSFFSKIYYPEYGSIRWYGDMFSIDNWIKCSV